MITEILRDYLSFKDEALKKWMLELLDSIEKATSLITITAKLDSLFKELSSSHALLHKAPYGALLLAYAYHKWGDDAATAAWAGEALDKGFGNGGEPHNHAMTLWVRALARESTRDIEDAWEDINDALKLMTRELDDCKRRSRLTGQKSCECILEHMLETMNRVQKEFPFHIPP